MRSPSSYLLSFSIAFSVAVLCAMLSLGEAKRHEVVRTLNLPPPGEDNFIVYRVYGKQETKRWPISRQDVLAVRQIEGVKAASAQMMYEASSQPIKFERNYIRRTPIGIDEQSSITFYSGKKQRGSIYKIVEGRAINASDVETGAKVFVTDLRTKKKLGIRQIGDTVRITGEQFELIGLYDKGFIEIPITAYTTIFGKDTMLQIRAKDDPLYWRETLIPGLQKIFGEQYSFDFQSIWKDLIKQEHQRAKEIMLARGLLGAVPLAITFFGALGISVAWLQERRADFALLRALGATRLQIARQAALEPLILVSFGALLGLGFGALIILFLQHCMDLKAAFNWLWFLLAWAVGLAAMLPPSLCITIRAAFIPPAEAMRT